MFEHHRQPLLPRRRFVARLLSNALLALAMSATALAIGVLGYHYIARLNWVDALLNSSMLLGGMGPVDALTSNSAKLFASFYALFSGIVFLVSMAVLLSPVVHRLMHRFHLAEEV
jgi:hypothetical protein